MVKANKFRSRSAGPQPYQNRKNKHSNMTDLMDEDDRKALSLNKFEESMTLAELQDRIKRQPDQYKKEFSVHYNIFAEKLKDFKLNPARKDQEIIDYLKFMAHVSGVYRQQIGATVSNEMLNLLQQYYSILHTEVRMTLVTCLKIMRKKDIVSAAIVIPVFLKLFRCKDKELRKFLHRIIIADMRQLNANAKNININRKLQNFILGLLQDPNEDAAKRSLNVMIELYKRRVWDDEKTVNAIWQGVMHSNPKICAAACKFFLILDYEMDETASEDSSDREEAVALLKNHKGSKLTKAKKKYLERAVKA